MNGGVYGVANAIANYTTPQRGTYQTYRLMRTNPTIALARAIAHGPIRSASYSVEGDDGVSDDIVNFITSEIKVHWDELIRNILYALDYGWSPFEKVWAMNEDGQFVYRKLKPLLVDKTMIRCDNQTGNFEGLKNASIDLPKERSYIFSYDMEAGNWYGRSRHENIRLTAWNQWDNVSIRSGQYMTKIAGIIPVIEYPLGNSEDADGKIVDNFTLAKSVLDNLGKGSGVAMPNVFAQYAGDLARSGIDLQKLKAWNIDFLESKGSHGKDFNDTLRHRESLLMRGWLVPERVATEGQSGTKAESESQGEWAMLISDALFKDITNSINWFVVNPLLLYNFGPQFENKVRVIPAGISGWLRDFYQKIVEKVLTAPANVDLFMAWVDAGNLLDLVKIPKTEDTITIPENRETDDNTDENDLTKKANSIIKNAVAKT